MLRLILSPRWIMWHVLTIGAMVSCFLLSAWQWRRAGSAMGSALNIGYGLQWPLFALFFGVMWFRMLRMEIRRLRGEPPEEFTPPALGRAAAPVAGAAAPVAGVEPVPAGPTPFGPRPAARAAAATDDDGTDPELAAYNRMLAKLAEHDRAS